MVQNSTTMRLPYLDYARVFVAYLVIFGHLLSENNYCPRMFIYQFHMALFFIISGMLHRYPGIIQWGKHITTILWPVFTFNMLYIVLIPLFYHIGLYYIQGLPDGFAAQYVFLLKRFAFGIIHSASLIDGPTWFLIALFYCKIFMDVLLKNKWIGVLSFVGLWAILVVFSKSPFYMRNGLMAIPFYVFGYYSKETFNSLILNKLKSIAAALALFTMMICIALFNGRASMYVVIFGSMPVPINVLLFYLSALAGSIAFLVISQIFEEHYVVASMAKSLPTILCLQWFLFFSVFNFARNSNISLALFISVIVLLICWGAHYILKRYFPIIFTPKR